VESSKRPVRIRTIRRRRRREAVKREEIQHYMSVVMKLEERPTKISTRTTRRSTQEEKAAKT
jgi:hypothetical protein